MTSIPFEQEFQELRDKVQKLEDIEEVRLLKHRYFRCIDTANLTELAELLHKDFSADVRGGWYHHQLKGRDAWVDLIRYSFHSEFKATHTGHHPEIEIIDRNNALGRWYLTEEVIDFRRNFFMTGASLYNDRYIKEDGRWFILHLQYERIYEIVDYGRPKPNFTAHYLGEHGVRHPPGVFVDPRQTEFY